jgi:ankyrin repeat protein
MSLKVKCFRVFFLILIVSCSERKEYNYNDLIPIVQQGDLKEFNKILRYTNVNVTDSIGNTILMFAVQNSNVQMVKQLLQLKADPNMVNNKELSALDISRNNKTEEISELIKEFQYTDWKKHNNKFTEEFFEYAINNDNVKIVDAFLKNGRDINDPTISNGLSPIVNAIFANSQEVVFLLLDNKVNPDHSFDTRPIITIAAMFNQYEVVKKIIEKGGDVNALDGPLTSALMFAAEEGNLEIVKLLITNGADASLVDRKNETALDKAKAKKRDKVVAFLSKKK